MARHTGPKNKLARRENQDLGLKTPGTSAHASLQKRLNTIPGEHGKKYRRRPSDYALRLREKQKAKRMYGVLEKQFRKYVDNAVAEEENSINALVEQLERRLDNAVYRLNLAPTRAAARQMVNHGHVFVDGEKISIPSYPIQQGQKITLSDKAKNIPAVVKINQEEEMQVSEWLTKKEFSGKISTLPGQDSVSEPVDWQYIIEFYTR